MLFIQFNKRFWLNNLWLFIESFGDLIWIIVIGWLVPAIYAPIYCSICFPLEIHDLPGSQAFFWLDLVDIRINETSNILPMHSSLHYEQVIPSSYFPYIYSMLPLLSVLINRVKVEQRGRRVESVFIRGIFDSNEVWPRLTLEKLCRGHFGEHTLWEWRDLISEDTLLWVDIHKGIFWGEGLVSEGETEVSTGFKSYIKRVFLVCWIA